MHEYLLRNNDSNITYKIRNNKSCKDIYMDNRDESESENSIINDKISRGQQTISNGRNFDFNDFNNIENEKNGETNDINYHKKEKQLKKENIYYKINKKGKKKKFTIDYYKNRSNIYYKKKNNSCNNKINIIWRNLRRPIVMNFNSSLKFY